MRDCQRQRRPIAVDLFAGVGGFSLGIEQAGFEVAVAVEKDPVHAAVYAYNFPQSVVLCADITRLQGVQIQAALRTAAPHAQEIDLLIGGPPCQGFSIMGKRNPNDARNTLIFQFCRLVGELQPRYFVMENVPGLKQGKLAGILARLMAEFDAVGYECTEPILDLNAADFGVPQQRKRLFLLGTRKAGNHPILTYPQPETCLLTVKDAIADLPNLDEFRELQSCDQVELSVGQLRQLEAAASHYVKQLRGQVLDPDNFAYPRNWERQVLTSSLRTQHTPNSIQRFADTDPGQQEPISRLRRLDWNRKSYTLRAGTGAEGGRYTSARPLHPEHPRVISVREAARLHSFPDWFRFHVTKWHGFRQVGNAVPPLLARAIGRQVMEALELVPLRPTEAIALGNPQLLSFNKLQAVRYWHSQSFLA